MSFFEELKRRNVFRVGIAYGVAAWLLIQLSDILVPLLGLPESVQKIILLLLIIGFIPALIFAWAFELTPEGIRKEKDVDRSQSIAPQTGRKLDRTIIVILALAVAFLLYRQLGQPPGQEAAAPQTVPDVAQTLGKPDQAPTVTPASEQIKSVAVLPFVNMSSDPEQEYFSDGLSEELLNRLANNDQLRVAARTSAFQFKGQNLDIADIGRQLNVANVLEGSVRKAGKRLRITAQLIRVENGFHIWSETYERELDDVFAIQDDISSAIAKALEIELGTSSKVAAGAQPTQNLEAYNLYLQARYLLAQRGDENMREADNLFSQAVALDPEFASAWSGMAFNSALLYGYSPYVSLEESDARTMQAAQRAIELDPANPEAYTAIGRTQTNTWHWKEARSSFERAFELGPNNVGVLNLYGDFLWQIGEIDRAIAMKQQAISLDPLSGVLAGDLAEILTEAGEAEKAVAEGERGVRLAPDSLQRANSLFWALVANGAFDRAGVLIDATAQSMKGQTGLRYFLPRWKAMLYYRQGNDEALRKIVDEAVSARQGRSESATVLEPSLIAFFTLGLEGPETAIPWLEEAYREHDQFLDASWVFYLPEQMSQDPAWLAFWDKPKLKELHELRRASGFNLHSLWVPPARPEGKAP